jgi:L-seryl-tRNA(Ser) seleniumtransferase
MSQFGLADEPMAQDSVRAGADLITFSGDKLLGGPQAGIIIGRRDLIEECKQNPLARVVRVDKLTLAGLEATLRLYLDTECAVKSIPALRFITRPISEIARNARRLASQLRNILDEEFDVQVVDIHSQVGGGSLPAQDLPSKAVALRSNQISTEDLSGRFRSFKTPVFGRIVNDRFILDMRTVESAEIKTIIDCALAIACKE